MSDHLANAKRLLAIAESSDAKREAYRAAAEEVAAYQAETGESAASIAILLDRSAETVRKMLAWRKRGYDTDSPYDEGPEKKNHQRAATSHAKRVLRDPEQRTDLIEQLTVDERAEVATTLLADPDVVAGMLATPAPARSHVKGAVDREDSERREKERERREQRAHDEAMPLPAYMATMVTEINRWALGLAGIDDADLDGLPEGRSRELVLEAASELVRQAQRWIDRLERRPDLRVIEGRVRDAS